MHLLWNLCDGFNWSEQSGECLFMCLHAFAGFFYRGLSGFAKQLTGFTDIFVSGALENKLTLIYKNNFSGEMCSIFKTTSVYEHK